MRHLLVVAVCALVVPVLAPAAPVPKHLMKAAPVYYYPTTVGTTWVYEDPNGQEETLTISAVETKADAKVVTVERPGADGAVVWEKMAVSETGLVRIEGLGGKLDPPLVMLQGPFKVGNKFEIKTAGLKGVNEIGAFESVKVPAGTFDAVRVESDYALGGGPARIQDTFWYAPGVGLVQRTDAKDTFRVLKSFTPGK